MWDVGGNAQISLDSDKTICNIEFGPVMSREHDYRILLFNRLFSPKSIPVFHATNVC